MSVTESLDRQQIMLQLDELLEVEFSFLHTDSIADTLAELPGDRQDFLLQWTRRVASTNIQLGYEFAARGKQALDQMDDAMISAWCLHAMDNYDRAGLHAAISILKDLQGFRDLGHLWAASSSYDEASAVLSPFLHGLAGRQLKMEAADVAWTDGEVLYLPQMMARLENRGDNFQLYKATAAHLWAQTRFGTLNVNPAVAFSTYPDSARAQALYFILETIRLDARLAQELPGLFRQMLELKGKLGDAAWPVEWSPAQQALAEPGATAEDSLHWLSVVYGGPDVTAVCYQGQPDLEAAWEAREQRLLRDKARLREALRVIAEEIAQGRDDHRPPASFDMKQRKLQETGDLPKMEVLYLDQLMPLPDHAVALMNSIMLDLGEVPEEYLVPAGPGEYDPGLLRDMALNPQDVWAGTYHEEGAFLYDEWDFGRQNYRKRWCVLRETDIVPGELAFYRATLDRYRGHIKSLHRSFEVLRGEDKLLRRQSDGEEVDIDAFVEGWADLHTGLEMNDRLFTRMHKDERNIAVLFMVDMSGSTKGWINEAEKEALILLVEALEILGDRYAIYGFSGWARKRCETYRIKTFEEPIGEEVRARICGLEPRDYTRMGAPIRHFTRLLQDVDARIKLLITLSDGKPDDYDHYYRGEYGIEDTRQALFEARVAGVHPFCITIDREGADYLPHMYGKANYVVLDDVAKLPLKVSDIYRKITS